MAERRTPRRIRTTIAATRGAISASLRGALEARDTRVVEFALDQADSWPPASGSAAEPSSAVVIIGTTVLPTDVEQAAGVVAAVRDHGFPVLLVGPGNIELAESLGDHIHAWLPDAADEATLVTAVRGALVAHATARDLETTRRQLLLKNDEALSLYEIGTALSSEHDIVKLQELILRRCRELTSADAGSLYILDEDSQKRRILRFEAAQNDSVPLSYQRFTMPLTPESIAGYVALYGGAVNLTDAYDLPDGAPYTHNRSFDERMGYRTKSMLVMPMRNHEGDVIGVIQLINRKREFDTLLTSREVAEREVIPFTTETEQVLDAFAGQAAVALDNRLLLESIEQLFEGFVRASIASIEARDPTTSGHSERVAELTVRIAEAVTDIAVGHWAPVHFDERQIREIRYAGLLHDFGKIGVREHILVKAKKLYDWQLDHVRLRFALARRALEARYAQDRLAAVLKSGPEGLAAVERPLGAALRQKLRELDESLATILLANEPSLLQQEAFERLVDITTHSYEDPDGNERPLIDSGELLSLSVSKGSLTETERKEIESHVSYTFRFLTLMPWTRHLKQVPLIAGAHHEKLDGSGYPNGLRGQEIPMQSRMMTIADIYDALTAADRPYKRAVPLAKALDILTEEARAGQLDTDLMDVFIERRVYEGNAAVADGVASGAR
ncbi:MAG: hypothetical protein HW416_736 [Chloroflexi bacterium]|nr:hypothetical protein [Chloroflexota bacterium]